MSGVWIVVVVVVLLWQHEKSKFSIRSLISRQQCALLLAACFIVETFTSLSCHVVSSICSLCLRQYNCLVSNSDRIFKDKLVELFIYFASAAVAVDSSHVTASSSASWSRFSPPSNFVNWHVSTMWFMVCRWPQSQERDWARPH